MDWDKYTENAKNAIQEAAAMRKMPFRRRRRRPSKTTTVRLLANTFYLPCWNKKERCCQRFLSGWK